MATKTVDLSAFVANMPAGSNSITIKAKGQGVYTNSANSNAVSYTVYSISATTTNCSAKSTNVVKIGQNGTASLIYEFDGTNYKCPETAPTVTGATGTWTKNSDTQGTMALSSPTGNVSFTVVGEAISTSETWVINSEADVSTVDFSIGFTSNSTSYSAMTINILGSTGVGLYYDSTLAASGRAPSVSSWVNESYRTVTFSTAPTGDLLTWLQANAVKI